MFCQNTKKLLFLTFLLFYYLFPSIINAERGIHPVQYTLSYHHKPLKLSTDVVVKDDIVFVPIRDILQDIKGSIRFKRKNQHYELTLPNKPGTYTIQKNSARIWIQNQQYFMSQSTFVHDTRLYVPLKEFAKYVGYIVQQKDNHISLINSPKSVSKLTPTGSKKAIVSSAMTSHQPFTSSSLSGIDLTKKNLSLAIQNKQYSIQKESEIIDGVLFVKLGKWLTDLGYSYSTQTNAIELSRNQKKWSLSNSSKTVTSSHQSPYQLEALPIIRSKGSLVPFESFLSMLGFGYHYQRSKHQIALLSPITAISFATTQKRLPTIKISSHHPIYALDPKPLFWRKGLYIDIPLSTLSLADTSFNVSSDIIYRVESHQKNPSTVRLKLLFQDKKVDPHIETSSDGLAISLYNRLSSISHRSNSSQFIITIKGKGPFLTKHWSESKPNRYVIDIDNTMSHLPQIIPLTSGPLDRIRTSQFTENPLKTRIVLDFKGSSSGVQIRQTSKELVLIIANKKNNAFVAAKSSKKHKKKTKTKRVKKGSLKHKIVILDPGHGGYDPGGIGIQNTYEKHYTLDISKRLKKLLEKEGAYVVLTRERDHYLSLQKRAIKANRNRGDIFLSIHLNSHSSHKAHGMESYYYKAKDKRLASHLQKQLNKDLNFKNNGIKRARFFVLRHTKMPSALVEPGFLSNKANYKHLKKPSYRQKIAQSLFQGIKNYFK